MMGLMVDGGGGQLVEKVVKKSKNRQKSKNIKGLKNLEKPLVRKNVY